VIEIEVARRVVGWEEPTGDRADAIGMIEGEVQIFGQVARGSDLQDGLDALSVRSSLAVYFSVFDGWWMYAQAAFIRPGVSIGYCLFTGSAKVVLPYFASPSRGSASGWR
jgi:hypothetical protein